MPPLQCDTELRPGGPPTPRHLSIHVRPDVGASLADLAQIDTALPGDTLTSHVADMFEHDSKRRCFVIGENGVPEGLVTREKLHMQLSQLYGNALFRKKPVLHLMDSRPLILDGAVTPGDAASRATARPHETRYDPLVVTVGGTYYGTVAVFALLDHVNDEAVRRARAAEAVATQLTALQRVTAALATVQTPHEVAGVVVAEGSNLFGAEMTAIRLLSSEGAWLDLLRSHGVEHHPWLVERLPVSGSSPHADALHTGLPVWLDSEGMMGARYPVALAPLITSGDCAAAVLPLLANGRVLGTLTLCFTKLRCFEPEDQEFLLTVAGLTAQALDRARLYVHEHERAEMAADLARMRGDFVASVSHELRTPLTAIVGYGELLAARWSQMSDESRREAVQRIVVSANRQKKLVEDLLLVSRMDVGVIAVDCEVVDLAAQMDQAVAEVQASYAGQRIARAGPSGIRVQGEAGRIVQVLVNLLDNAAKYSPESSAVEVAWESVGASAIIRVRDHGPGIPAEGRERLFTRFGRIPGSRIRSGRVGAGLGLYLGRQLAQAMGGELDLESTGPGGSTFRFVLPLAASSLQVAVPGAGEPAIAEPNHRERKQQQHAV